MMDDAIKVNEATGEVLVKIAGEEYRLKATFRNLAEYQARTAVIGLTMLHIHINQADARALFQGMKCLCISGNADKLDDINPIAWLAEIQGAIIKAITWGLPTVEDATAGKELGTTDLTAAMN